VSRHLVFVLGFYGALPVFFAGLGSSDFGGRIGGIGELPPRVHDPCGRATVVRWSPRRERAIRIANFLFWTHFPLCEVRACSSVVLLLLLVPTVSR
jgi:hypothetical protein